MSHLVKVLVNELQFGMYVSKLDRPWTETPFLFQGFEITSSDTIQKLGEYCEYVYVDPEISHTNISAGAIRAPAKSQHDPHQVNKAIDEHNKKQKEREEVFKYTDFKHELKHALDVHQSAHNYIKTVMQDVRVGHSIDTKSAKILVSELADSVVTNSTALLWLTNLKDRDEYTSQHSLNVCILSLVFGQHLGLNTEELNNIGVGALLHDIGKLRVPLNILNKPASLTDHEFGVMKKHPSHGYELLKNGYDLHETSLDIIHHHHERLDGTGYPDGLKGEQIAHFTKMVAIIDVYDAVTSKRVYHDETTPYDALNKLYNESSNKIDRQLLEKFIKCVGIYPVGSVVELNTGHVGVVVATSDEHHLHPVVMLVLDHHKKHYEQRKFINLANPKFGDRNIQLSINKIISPESVGIDLTSLCLEETFSRVG